MLEDDLTKIKLNEPGIQNAHKTDIFSGKQRLQNHIF